MSGNPNNPSTSKNGKSNKGKSNKGKSNKTSKPSQNPQYEKIVYNSCNDDKKKGGPASASEHNHLIY